MKKIMKLLRDLYEWQDCTRKYRRFASEYVLKRLRPGFRLVEVACYGFNISRNFDGTWKVYVLIVGVFSSSKWTNGNINFSPDGECVFCDIIQSDQCMYDLSTIEAAEQIIKGC